MMKIERVDRGSPAEAAGVRAGDELLAVGGATIRDGLDFTYHGDEEVLELTLRRPDGSVARVTVSRDEHGRLGIELPPDPVRCCGNQCVFCFIDQNPRGLRRSLYVKDEDYRLSPFHGNYVTLTNLAEWEIERIIEQHLDPLYVSVHATDPEVRARMLRPRGDAAILPILRRLARGGIRMHTQIVLVPGYNDAAVLDQTLADLEQLYPAVETVAVVPVGLTSHRDRLPALEPVTAAGASEALDLIEARARRSLGRRGTRLHFAADELYLLAGRAFPEPEAYEAFPQIENGVGMVRAFEIDLADRDRLLSAAAVRALERGNAPSLPSDRRIRPDGARTSAPGRALGESPRVALVSGGLFAPLLERRAPAALARTGESARFDARVLAVHNRLFGPGVTVAGLLAGADVIAALGEHADCDLAVLPAEMFNEDGWTLDHLDAATMAEQTGRPVQVGWDGPVVGGI